MQNGRNTGINAALISALFLGLAPVFGKAAMGEGKFSPLAVVALRTSMAALLLVIALISSVMMACRGSGFGLVAATSHITWGAGGYTGAFAALVLPFAVLAAPLRGVSD